MTMTVNLLHTFGTEVSLGNHFHFDLGGLDAVALTDHRTKGAIAGEITVASYQQIA